MLFNRNDKKIELDYNGFCWYNAKYFQQIQHTWWHNISIVASKQGHNKTQKKM